MIVDYAALTDEALAIHLQGGDHEAFDQLMERHNARCLRYACKLLGNFADAEEEVQNTFMRVYQHIGQFQNRAKFSHWLMQILGNQCRMRFRKSRKMPMVAIRDEFDEEQPGLQIVEEGPTPEQQMIRLETITVANQRIDALPKVYREVLVLRYEHHWPIDHIATHLGLSIAGTKSRLLRGRTKLRHHVLSATRRRHVQRAA
jgi:RNA polymerase sigma-70 factor (ECF subfamily)